MGDQANKDTRNIMDVFIESLDGADRVVVETKNALGAMDASYLHAPEILKAWNTRHAPDVGGDVMVALEEVVEDIIHDTQSWKFASVQDVLDNLERHGLTVTPLTAPTPPTVKALVWVCDDKVYYANSIMGQFSIEYDGEYGWTLMLDGHDNCWVKYPHSEYGFSTPDQGKDECLRYLIKCVLSQLEGGG